MSTRTPAPLPTPPRPESVPLLRFGPSAAEPIAAIPPRLEPLLIQPGAVLPHLGSAAANRGAPR